jgi:hypothetical protein
MKLYITVHSYFLCHFTYFYVPNNLFTKLQKIQISLSGSVTAPVEQPVCHLVPVLYKAGVLLIVLWCSTSAQSAVGS